MQMTKFKYKKPCITIYFMASETLCCNGLKAVYSVELSFISFDGANFEIHEIKCEAPKVLHLDL